MTATTTTNTSSTTPLRVVMVLANPFTHDTRVYKQARSLIEWGCDVHIVAMAQKDLPAEEVVDGIHVHRVQGGSSDMALVLPALLLWPFGQGAARRLLDGRRPLHGAAHLKRPARSPRARARVKRRRHLGWPVLSGLRHSLHDRADGGNSGLQMGRLIWHRVRRSCKWCRGVARSLARLLGTTGRAIVRAMFRRIRATVGGGRRLLVRGWKNLKRQAGRVRHPMLRLLPFNIAAARVVAKLAPDVIECHDVNTLVAGMIVKKVYHTPVVYDSHELWLHRNIGDRSRTWDSFGWAPIERYGIRRADAVMTVAEGICRHLERQYHLESVILLRNVQPWEPPAPRSTLLADELGLPPETEIVLYPGAITINRGLEQMIDAAPYMKRGVFVVMGYARNAKYLASLHARAEANGSLGRTVLFRDAVPIDAVGRYVASSSLGIVPTQNACLSYFFESSNKIFHCLMAGVPIVASDHAEKRLLVENYGIGRLFDETDPSEIARVVDEVLGDRASQQSMRGACLKAARTLNWEHEEHRLRSVFAKILGDRAPKIPEIRLPDAPLIEIETTEAVPSP